MHVSLLKHGNKKVSNPPIFHTVLNEIFLTSVPASVGIPLWMVSEVFLILFLQINSKKNLDSYCFVTYFGLFIFEK
jgi:hypothetical protein